MAEYLLVLAVITGVTLAVLTALSQSSSFLINALVANVHAVTGVQAP